MPYVAENVAINQRLQFGVESTSALGTNVAANKLLQCYTLDMTPMADVKMFEPTGRKYPSTQIENSEWTEMSLGGTLDYNGIIYALASACGSASPIAHGASSVAKDWIFTPPVTGGLVPQTYTIEQGDSAISPSVAHKVNYALINELAYKGDRKAGITVSGKVMAQALQQGIAMTSTPTAVAIAPVAGKHINVYIDSTSAALGTTQLLKVLDIDWAFSGIYGMFFPLNRANLGWSQHIDLNPGCIFKLLMEADSVGMAELPILQSGATQFLRINAQGLIIDNLQTVTIGGGATGGTFTLSYKGQTTAPITYSAALASATVNTAFQLLSTVLTNCTVTGSAGGPYIFTFSGTLASDMSPVGVTNVSLAGGTPTVASVAQAYNVFQHDMAVKVSKPAPFSDKDGIYAVEWEFTVVEDATWGKAQTFLVTNNLTAL